MFYVHEINNLFLCVTVCLRRPAPIKIQQKVKKLKEEKKSCNLVHSGNDKFHMVKFDISST